MKRVLLDTDIGDDIDDALALGYLGRSPDIYISGVSTVFLKTKERADLAGVILSVMGLHQMPVVAGYGRPLNINDSVYRKMLKNHKPKQLEILSNYKSYVKPYNMDVVEFLKNNISAFPNEITLLTIGPLTNIGALLRKYPQIAGKIKEIVIMGGVISMPFPEWNILCDPEAAEIVFSSGALIKMIGLDVTLKCVLEEKHIKSFEISKKTLPVLLGKLIRLWQHQCGRVPGKKVFPCPVLHDPLAAMSLNSKDLLEYKPFRIVIEKEGKYSRGMTCLKDTYWSKGKNGMEVRLHPSGKKNCLVAVNVDSKKAVKTFTERILT